MQQLFCKNTKRAKDFANFALYCRERLVEARPSFDTAGTLTFLNTHLIFGNINKKTVWSRTQHK